MFCTNRLAVRCRVVLVSSQDRFTKREEVDDERGENEIEEKRGQTVRGLE